MLLGSLPVSGREQRGKGRKGKREGGGGGWEVGCSLNEAFG